MKRIGIYGSMFVGDVHDHHIDYVGVDQGTIHLLNLGIRPQYAIGDFDSLENPHILDSLRIYRYPTHKDDTDTALAIQSVIEQGYDCIDLYGVTHGRIDHFMAVLCLLKKYRHIHITVYDEYNKIFLLKKGKHRIQKDQYHYFSLFSYQDTYVTLKDCHYPLDHYLLACDNPLCVSNQMNKESVEVDIDQDVLWIQSK